MCRASGTIIGHWRSSNGFADVELEGASKSGSHVVTDDLDLVIRELVVANRILARENVCDAYGHVSIRHPRDPERFFLSWSRSPERVEIGDIVEYRLDGKAIDDDRPGYHERFIHGGIYETRPEVHSVIHAHAEDVLPFGVSSAKLRPIIGAAAVFGPEVPVWDIADRFGGETNLLVGNMEQARDLARAMGSNNLVLMRGHGMAVAASNLLVALKVAIYAPCNARVQLAAMRLGEPHYLSSGEMKMRSADPYFGAVSHSADRVWDYWASRAGCSDLLRPDKP